MQSRTLSSLASERNGFDTIRLLAATAVIFSHAFPITGYVEPLHRWTGQASLGTLAVSAFFLISGYLIPASLDRGSLARYAQKRARRIMPALVVSVAVSAFCFGLAFTRLPAAEYLADPGTWRFLGNAVFLPVGFDLPGVFLDHPMRAVNGSLWSLKFEMACYVFVPLAFAFARFRKAAIIAAWLASFVLARLVPENAGGLLYYIGTIAELFRFFGTGMIFYLYAGRIAIRKDWGWLAFAVFAGSAFTPFFVETAATFGAYALITFAYECSDAFRKITAKGDISYGVYVYAFPIQQSLVPATIGFAWPWLANALFTLPLAAAAGLLSWLLVEKPALHRRRKVVAAPAVSA